MEELRKIQQEIQCGKGQQNQFGNYAYRSCEDITRAVKPLLNANNCVLTLDDELVNVGNRNYVKATATLVNAGGSIVTTHGFACEAEQKKGMDSSQITGATSSYARKYALAGMFLLDDEKDADATNTHGKQPQQQTGQDSW
jgi:hypothetical protein